MSVALSGAVRTNLFALQQIATDIARGQQRLATGRRVNGPSDDPTAYFTASTLTARAAALTTVADDIGSARKVLQMAGTGLDFIQKLIGAARDLAYQALGASSTIASITGTVNGMTPTTAIAMAAGNTITVSDGTTTATYTHAPGKDIQDFLDAVNNTAGLAVDATLVDGRIKLTASSSNSITIGGTATAGELAALGLSASTATGSVSAQRQALAEQFDAIRAQIDQMAGDAGFNGRNLLAGDALIVRLNESGSSTLTVNGSAVTAAGLGIKSAVTAGGNFQSNTDVNAFLTDLYSASAALDSQAASYASNEPLIANRQAYARSMGSVLTTGADNLVFANIHEEAAQLLALRVHQQLATTSLSLASQAQSSVLRLFRV